MTRWHERVRELLEREAETEQAMLGSGPGDHDHGASHDPSADSPGERRIPVDDTPDYFSHVHRSSHEEESPEIAHAHAGFRSAFRWPTTEHHENRKDHQPRPRSYTERPQRDERRWGTSGSKTPERRTRSAHRAHRARSPSTVSVSSTSSDSSTEDDPAPRRASHHSDSRRHREHDRLFPPSTFRDRRHSYQHIHKTPSYDPSRQPQYGPHLPPAQVQPSRQQGALPRGTARVLDPRTRDVANGSPAFAGSAPSTPGGYTGRAPVRYVESGRDGSVERPLIRRFVSPVRGVGGRRYIAP